MAVISDTPVSGLTDFMLNMTYVRNACSSVTKVLHHDLCA